MNDTNRQDGDGLRDPLERLLAAFKGMMPFPLVVQAVAEGLVRDAETALTTAPTRDAAESPGEHPNLKAGPLAMRLRASADHDGPQELKMVMRRIASAIERLAIPPVRADREAAHQAIYKHLYQALEKTGLSDTFLTRDLWQATKLAADDLSLSVQPGAGEREALCELLRQFICEFWIDKPQMVWKRTLCDDGVEMVHHEGDTIFFGDANHKEPSDTARFDLIVELANATPKMLRALSRQPPQSSREG